MVRGAQDKNTRYEIRQLKRIGFAMKRTKEGVFSGIGRLFGRRDVEVGDPILDGKLKGRDHSPGGAEGISLIANSAKLSVKTPICTSTVCCLSDVSGGTMFHPRFFFVSVVLLMLAPVAFGGTVFHETFDAENGGVGKLNHAGFTQWTVTAGTVDLIGVGTEWDLQPGNGLYLDMDGSTWSVGTILSSAIALAGNTTYTLTFRLAGNNRGNLGQGKNADHVTAQVLLGPLFTRTYSLQPDEDFQLITETFTTPVEGGTYQLKFAASGISDNVGMLLDDVTLMDDVTPIGPDALPPTAVVPLPGSAWIGIGMLSLLAAARRYRRR